MKHILAILLAGLAVGCGRPVPTAKYFAGQPVQHWLAAVTDPNPKVRKKAADVLGNIGPADPAVVPALVMCLNDADAAVRDAAALGLSKMGPAAAAATPALHEACTDSDPSVRGHASAALRRVRGAD